MERLLAAEPVGRRTDSGLPEPRERLAHARNTVPCPMPMINAAAQASASAAGDLATKELADVVCQEGKGTPVVLCKIDPKAKHGEKRRVVGAKVGGFTLVLQSFVDVFSVEQSNLAPSECCRFRIEKLHYISQCAIAKADAARMSPEIS